MPSARLSRMAILRRSSVTAPASARIPSNDITITAMPRYSGAPPPAARSSTIGKKPRIRWRPSAKPAEVSTTGFNDVRACSKAARPSAASRPRSSTSGISVSLAVLGRTGPAGNVSSASTTPWLRVMRSAKRPVSTAGVAFCEEFCDTMCAPSALAKVNLTLRHWPSFAAIASAALSIRPRNSMAARDLSDRSWYVTAPKSAAAQASPMAIGTSLRVLVIGQSPSVASGASFTPRTRP